MQIAAPVDYLPMFISMLIMNTGFAMETFQATREPATAS